MTTRLLLNAALLGSFSLALAGGCTTRPAQPVRVLPVDRDIDGNVIERVAAAVVENGVRSEDLSPRTTTESGDWADDVALFSEEAPSREDTPRGGSASRGTAGDVLRNDEAVLPADARWESTARPSLPADPVLEDRVTEALAEPMALEGMRSGGVGGAVGGDASALSERRARVEFGYASDGDADGFTHAAEVTPGFISDLEPAAEREATEAPAGFDESLDPGRLTAGTLDDLADTAPFRQFAADLAGEDDDALPALMTGATFALRVTGETGVPLGNAAVEVTAFPSDRALQLTTRTDGTAVVSLRWDELESEEDLVATVTLPNGASRTVTVDPANPVTHTIRMPGVIAQPPVKTLDIAVLMDCTGSMSDELEYLKVELRSISEALAELHPGVEQRFALVAYRDAEEDYVTRTFDFAGTLAYFIEDLGAQRANGGGDEPEAVHRAFAEAVGLDWTEGSAARVVLWVADAPPHADQMTPTLRHVDTLREMGVVVVPVASSGANTDAQFIMRSAALLTGGEHVFLTDDSGVGNAHTEPTQTAGYAVMPLRDQLLRLLSAEVAGQRIPVDDARVLRRVPPSAE